MRLPDWYLLDKIAARFRCKPWEFEELPEPQKTYWYNRAIVALEAESEAWQLNHPPQV